MDTVARNEPGALDAKCHVFSVSQVFRKYLDLYSLNGVFRFVRKLNRLRQELDNLCDSIATASFWGALFSYFYLNLFSTPPTSATTKNTSQGMCC